MNPLAADPLAELRDIHLPDPGQCLATRTGLVDSCCADTF